MAGYTLALDQGTTSSRALVFDPEGVPIAQVGQELHQINPQPGWVEYDPMEIWFAQRDVAKRAVQQSGISPHDLCAIGIANQRETTVLWERSSGQPVYNAISWQCRRSTPQCEYLVAQGLTTDVRRRTGLVVDAYFSATKLQWLFEHFPELRQRAIKGELCFGTIDSWLVYQMTHGRLHITDVSNAARTMLYNIHKCQWDTTLLEALQIPSAILPEVYPSSQVYGLTDSEMLFGVGVPIAGIVGDQQAALFGQACFLPGMVKQTYGTGSFLLMHTGVSPVFSPNGLLTTVAWKIGERVEYALEGSIFVAGAVIQWLRDGLQLLPSAESSEAIASTVSDARGIYFVPAFVGLGTPHWDSSARGTIIGLTPSVSRAHIVRAALESIAYQTRDVLEVMQRDASFAASEIRADGGAAANNLLMQLLADILDLPLIRAKDLEATARGASCMAGLATGVWSSQDDIAARWQGDKAFTPAMPAERRTELYAGWCRAVERAKGWVAPGAADPYSPQIEG